MKKKVATYPSLAGPKCMKRPSQGPSLGLKGRVSGKEMYKWVVSYVHGHICSQILDTHGYQLKKIKLYGWPHLLGLTS
jgi:hypothetical protein